MSSWIMPLPIVLATAVPSRKAAAKLKKAAQTTASFGESTRVDTTVAMLFAASWKPFKKSKVSATRTVSATSISPVFTGVRSSRGGRPGLAHASSALQNNRFQHVGSVLGLVGGHLQHLEQFLDLDQSDGVFFVLEEVADGFATYAIRLVFQAVDFHAVIEHVLVLLQ